MLISDYVKTAAFYIFYVVSFLIIFQTSNAIMSAVGSTLQDPDINLIDRSDMSFQTQDQNTNDLKKQFESGMEESNRDNWIFVNHDIYGTRNSNQTQIDQSNVGDLKVKWRLNNTYEIQDPPIIVNNSGYFQDYIGNIIAFDTLTGNIKWKLNLDGGPTMGLYFSDGIIYATIGTKAKIISIDSTNGEQLWESPILGDTSLGYAINSPPLIWKDYVIAGSGGSGLPPGKGFVKGNITALNKTDGSLLWNIETTTGEWIEKGKNPPNGGATAWSGGSIDADTGIAYIPLGSASPNFNASTRQSPNLYSNHMVAVDIKQAKIIWATPFIAHGTVLNLKVPDTHDWDTSWGSSVSNIKFENGSSKKIVIGHDKMGNVIAMDALTGEEIWWTTLGRQVNIDSLPSPSGSGMIWAYGVYNYHAVDDDTLYITATNRGLNFFTDGISGHKEDPENSIEQGLVNGTIYALDKKSGLIKWKIDTNYPPRVSPLVSNGVVYTGFIKFGENDRTGIIMALDSNTGEKLWEYDVRGSISPVGASIGNGMLFVPTDKVNLYPNENDDVEISGSIVAFMPIKE
ncbi:outer membrane protein assembly factor BamB family protein [Candidatus Nitrosocosmicus sp. T]